MATFLISFSQKRDAKPKYAMKRWWRNWMFYFALTVTQEANGCAGAFVICTSVFKSEKVFLLLSENYLF